MLKVKPEQLGDYIAKLFNEYIDEIDDAVIDVTNEVAKAAKNEVVRLSPRGVTGDYANGWTISISQKGINFFSKAIWNKKHYRLTHLLEFGHATKNGGHTKSQPHIQPVETKFKLEFVNKIEGKIKR